jgi:hypothetical protein
MARETDFYAYGYKGLEMEADKQFKIRLIFALADKHKKHLFWYMYSQDVRSESKGQFSFATMGGELDASILFGSLWSKDPSQQSFDFRVNLGKLAGKAPGTGTPALLSELFDDGSSTICSLSIYPEKNSVFIQFFLKAEDARHGKNVDTHGHVWLLGVEKFKLVALDNGPTTALHRPHHFHLDPYDPLF